jgi:alkylresorcinol/alkylpyrone synthase
MMFVNGVGTAVPPHCYTQAECWDAFKDTPVAARLDRRARALVEHVLLGDSGIATRHLVPASLGEVFDLTPDTLHRRFAAHAPRLASEAAARALEDAGQDTGSVDAVIISTCTGYLCPGITSYVIEALGLRPAILALDLVGQGCGAALPNWMMAEALLSAGRCRHVLSVSVEVSSAAIYVDDDPGVLISGCLFGDGAGAALLSHASRPGARRLHWGRGASIVSPALRGLLRFEQRGGMLRNILTRPVPQLAAEHAGRVLRDVLGKAGVVQEEIRGWIWHAGGRDVLLALQSELDLKDEAIALSRSVLRRFGNLSSAFVYFVLAEALQDGMPEGYWWMSSFGAGFSCHGALLEAGPPPEAKR